MAADKYPIDKDAWFGCWIWNSTINNHGYGTKWTKDGPKAAHHYVYELETGAAVPDGKVLDHLCMRRSCVNPKHLQVVSPGENTLRIYWRYRSAIKQCPAGHDLSIDGRRTPEGGSVCRICSGTWTPTTKEEPVLI